MTNLRWGILSTANIGTEMVIPAIQAGERCEVVAIASRNLDVANRVAADLGIERAYGSYGQLLRDSDIDAVYIPLPNHMHAEWTIASAAAGKHVLCEKPIALTSGEADSMIAAADEAGVILREAFMYQFHPTWLATKQLVDEGRIGEIVAVDSWFSYFNDDPANIRNIVDYGGGALMDIGCYSIHLSRMLLGGEPTAVKAAIRRDPEMAVDVVTTAIMEFDDRFASFGCSTRAEDAQRVDIQGSKGRINIEIPFNIPADRTTRISVYTGGNPPAEPNVEVLTFEPANQYTLQAEAFASAVLDGTAMPDTGAEAANNIRVIERVFAATGPSGWA